MKPLKTYDVVKQVLEELPTARNSDKVLIWSVWKKLGYAGEHIMLEQFMIAPSSETIRRSRQQIQAKHKHLQPTSDRIRVRRNKKEATRGTFIYRETI